MLEFAFWVLVALLIFGAFPNVESMFKRATGTYYKIRKEEMRTRQIEALAKLPEPDRQRLLESMPEWLDKDDEDDVEAWKKARIETNRTGKKE